MFWSPGTNSQKSIDRSARLAVAITPLLVLLLLWATRSAADPSPPEEPVTRACPGPIIAGAPEKLCGTLNPASSSKVGYFFAYNIGTGCAGGQQTPAGQEVEGEEIEVSAELTGLAPDTQYAYCLVATNGVGDTYGNATTFTTHSTSVAVPQPPQTDQRLLPPGTPAVELGATTAQNVHKSLKQCKKKRRAHRRMRCITKARSRYRGGS
jgi:hypothetical protein